MDFSPSDDVMQPPKYHCKHILSATLLIYGLFFHQFNIGFFLRLDPLQCSVCVNCATEFSFKSQNSDFIFYISYLSIASASSV